MIYDVIVLSFNPDIEEEIKIQFNNFELTCFVPYWNIDVEVNNTYKANIGVTILDEPFIKKQETSFYQIKQINDSFAYIINGKLNFSDYTIDCGFIIELDRDEVDLSNYAYLDNMFITLKVDRISLEFID